MFDLNPRLIYSHRWLTSLPPCYHPPPITLNPIVLLESLSSSIISTFFLCACVFEVVIDPHGKAKHLHKRKLYKHSTLMEAKKQNQINSYTNITFNQFVE